MYPNQPQEQPTYPPQPPQPQGATPPYPPQQAQQPQQTQQPAPGTYTQPPQYAQVQPQQYTPNGTTSIDYLNQIAPNAKGNGFTKKQLFIGGGILALALGVLLFMIISGSRGPSPVALSQQLIARTTSLEDTVKQSQSNIRSRNLSAVNSSLSVQLTSTLTSLRTNLSGVGIETTKLNQAIVEAESNAKLLEELEDARLNGIFDRVYLRELTYQLELLLVLIGETHTKFTNETIRTELATAHESLKALHDRLVELSASV